MRKITPFLQRIRQHMFPGEFRISATAYSKDVRDELTKAIDHFLKNWPPPTTPPPPVPDPRRLLFLADVGTGLWRMRRTMIPTSSPRFMEARPLDGMRKCFNWLVSVWDVLKENGIEIQDHTGSVYREGQDLKVPAFEPTPGIDVETVIDTIKPSIYLDGRMIQMGEVVVGTPEAASQGKS